MHIYIYIYSSPGLGYHITSLMMKTEMVLETSVFYASDAAECPRRLHWILLPRKLQIIYIYSVLICFRPMAVSQPWDSGRLVTCSQTLTSTRKTRVTVTLTQSPVRHPGYLTLRHALTVKQSLWSPPFIPETYDLSRAQSVLKKYGHSLQKASKNSSV